MIEVLKQALEALKDVGVLTDREWQAVHKNKANELRQAIAELESQEPVAFLSTDSLGERYLCFDRPQDDDPVQSLYTHPPQRKKVVFPTMLRKMWSGGEVQAWLDENVNKEKNI